MICLMPLQMIAVAAVQAAVKAELSYRKDTIIVFFFTAKKNNDSTNLRILALIWQGTAYFAVTDTTIFLWATHFLAPN